MIEKKIKDLLEKVLNIPIYLEMPDNKPNEFVIIEKVGSGEKSMIISSTFAFQSYSKSLATTIKLNEKVKKAVKSFVSDNDIIRVSLNTDYNFTDIGIKKYRYQAIFDIKHY